MKRILIYSIVAVLSLTVAKADPADPQDHTTWDVTANNYQYNMTVTTALVFDTTESSDVNDKIAAFVGNDCRGVAQPKTYVPEDDRYLAHLLVYSNATSGEQVTFYMYDHSEDEIVEVAKKLDFASNATYGSVDDPYLSITTYDVNIKVLAGSEPEEGATVSLGGYSDQTTDQEGLATFPDVEPSDSIHYSVKQDGYDFYEDSVALIDGPVTDSAHLTLTRSFHVKDTANNPLENATVNLDGYEAKQTNAKGNVSFSGINPTDSLYYSVSLEDYDFFEDSIAALPGTKQEETVYLYLTTYQVGFKVTDGNQPLTHATVFFDGYGEKDVNSQGRVQFREVLPADSIYYSVSAPEYDTYTNSLAIVDKDVTRKIDLNLTAYDVAFEVINGQQPVQDARVHLEGYGIKTTGIKGNVLFPNVILDDSIGYNISTEGYNTYYDSIAVVDGEVSEKATLKSTTYNSTLTVDNGSTPVANAVGTLEVPGESLSIDFDSATLPSDFQTKGDARWKVDSSSAFQGIYSIKSGELYDNQFAEISLKRSVVTGNISFYTKVSSEKDKDELIFYIDDKEMGRWSDTGWIHPTFEVEEGTHTFKWVYKKDGSRSVGSDCAWVDFIKMPSEQMVIKHDTSSSDGKLIFSSLLPYFDSLSYHISHPKYSDADGKIFVDDHNVTRNVHLGVDLTFKISKELDRKFIPSDSVYLQGCGKTRIDSNGYAVYKNVEPTDSLFYSINCPEYDIDSGYVSAMHNDTLSSHLKLTRYDVTFQVEYDGSSLSNGKVLLDGYGEKTFDREGQVQFRDVLPADSIYYSITATDYDSYANSLAVVDKDVTRKVDLSLTSYDVAFEVIDGQQPVQDARVHLEGYGIKKTDIKGNVLFTDVILDDSIGYNISAEGYNTYYDSIAVVEGKVSEKATLMATTYNTTFTIDNGKTPVANAIGTLEIPGESRDIDFDSTSLPSGFSTEGNAEWKVDSLNPFQGVYSIKSGTVYDNQFSEISFERRVVTGDFSFYTKVSSEKDKDYLVFYIDGKEMGRWSDTGWVQPTFKVQKGTHTFKWVYRKDGSRSRGSDCAWIDYIQLPSDSMVLKHDTSSSDGDLLFPSLLPHYDSLVYHIRHPKYRDVSGKIFIEDQNVDRNVHLTVDLAFKVNKEFDRKFVSSDSMYLQGYGKKRINSNGYAVYKNVIPTDSLSYKIWCPEYNVDSGSVSALYNDTITRNLKLTRYDVTFSLTYQDSPISGLKVNLGDQPELATNKEGKVTFTQIIPDTLDFTIDDSDYLKKSGSFVLAKSDTTLGLEILPVYSLEFIVESGTPSGNIPVDDATVELTRLDSMATTNSFGEATFEEVTPHDSILYKVSAEGYYDSSGVVEVSNSDVRHKVTLELEPTLEATNLITPNGDGKNDYWIIHNAERYAAFQVSIFTANGEKIYSTRNYSENKWDGKYHGDKLPDGVYYYVIKNPSGEIVFTGTINLVN